MAGPASAFFSGRPLVFAHRGASAYAPENSLVALRQALEMGAHGLEVDLRVTRDGVPVVFHDARLERLTDGRGYVRHVTYRELSALTLGYQWTPDGGRTFLFRDHGLRILSLEELLTTFPSTRVVLHFKSAAAARAARRQVEALGAAERVLASAEWSWRLLPFRGYQGPRSATTEEVARFLLGARLGLPARPGRPFLVPERRGRLRILSPRFIARAHAAGRAVVAWVINERADMARLLAWGVDGIMSDRPDLAVEVIRASATGGRR